MRCEASEQGEMTKKGLQSNVRKSDLKRFLHGYIVANRVISQERARRLPFLTPKDSRKEYDELCATWRLNPLPTISPKLNETRIRCLLLLRCALNKVSRKKSSESSD